jgi:hypothetical protein
MAFDLALTDSLKRQSWKVKIADKERVEPPHATIIHRTTRWRYGLRERAFLEDEPDPQGVPNELIKFIKQEETHKLLVAAWNRMYPNNPVAGGDDD